MATDPTSQFPTPTLDFEVFWQWVVAHPNCLLRAGATDSVLYDDDDFHWRFGPDSEETLLVQVLRGKRLVGEILVQPDRIAYVQTFAGDHEGEHVFELISETESERFAAYFFVLTHGFEDEDDDPASGRAIH